MFIEGQLKSKGEGNEEMRLGGVSRVGGRGGGGMPLQKGRSGGVLFGC